MQDTVHRISAPDGTDIPVYWHPADTPRCVLLLLPALGIQARLYQALAQGLAQRGCATALLEQRGHGLSPLRASHRQQFTLDDTLEKDIPTALDWLAQSCPGLPIVLGGHSLGGHLTTIYTGRYPDQVTAVLHLACAFPYYRDYDKQAQRMMRFLCAVIPLFGILPGHYPGKSLGFGERESVAMMKQWRQWALTGSFDFDDHRGLAQAVAKFTGPLLSISFDRDNFSTEAAVERAIAPYVNATVTRCNLGEAEQGQHLGHTGWAKQPTGVVEAVADWLATALPRSG